MLNALLKWQFPLYTADSVTFAMLLPNRIYLQARCMFYELVEHRAVQRQPCTVQTGGKSVYLQQICQQNGPYSRRGVQQTTQQPPTARAPSREVYDTKRERIIVS